MPGSGRYDFGAMDSVLAETGPAKTFELLEYGLQQRLPRGLLEAHLGSHLDHLRDEMVATFTAKVLSEDAGEIVVDSKSVSWEEARKPRWLPGFLWRRLPREKRTEVLEVRVQPKWTYPHAELPRLGGAVSRAQRLWW